MNGTEAIKIFFCYAHEDELYLNKLKSHLRPLQRQGLVDVWHDHDIGAGAEWEKEINKHLNKADIILLLVSPDFVNSDYCYSKELQFALERHERGEALVIPIILRHVHWRETPISKLQALPTDAKPIRGWLDIDEALYNVVEGVYKAVKKLSSSMLLHFIWIIDCSGSMCGDKIKTVNTAIRETIPEMRQFASAHPRLQLCLRTITFSTGSTWQAPNAITVEQFQWKDLQAGGVTDMGSALLQVADALKMLPTDFCTLPPILVLITDGQPTDDFSRGLQALKNVAWGTRAMRIAISIGHDTDEDILKRFIDNPELDIITATNIAALTNHIKWSALAGIRESLKLFRG